MLLSRWLQWLSPASSLRQSQQRTRRGRCDVQLEHLEERWLPSGGGNALDKLPLTFEANQGQADAAVRYLAHGSGYSLALTDQGATLELANGSQSEALTLQLVGDAATPTLLGLDPQAGVANYLLGNDP